ncbi:hypothetical protein ACQZV8_18630 [Magnetococcales bacterium HHB-1]
MNLEAFYNKKALDSLNDEEIKEEVERASVRLLKQIKTFFGGRF